MNNFFWETHYMYMVKLLQKLKLMYVLKTKKMTMLKTF